MPRNVRNFWIDARVDGCQSAIGTGPRAKDGGFDLTIKQRNRGAVTDAIEILGRARADGNLVLCIRQKGFDDVEIVTQR